MSRSKQTPEYEIVVDGETYVWTLHRRPQWNADDNAWQGMALMVRHLDGKREAILEFPPGRQPRFGAPLLQAARIPTDLVAKAIGSAIEAGWEPLSRGKIVTVVVDAAGN